MKLTLVFLIIFFLNNCSFDNKTGIWDNEKSILKKENDQFKDFKKLSNSQVIFNKTVPLQKEFEIQMPNLINPKQWLEIFYSRNNNFENFKYGYLNQVLLKTGKLTNNSVSEYKLFANDNLILNDQKGNLIIYSLKENRIVHKFNFYKKRYKNIKKKLNLIIENQIIYVSDNIGYLYAFNFNKGNLIWAKNYKVPFNSNLKISNKFIFTSNINNTFLVLDKRNGNIIKRIPTEEAVVQNDFKNNLAQNNDLIFFLNTFGSLYAVDQQKLNTKWYVNLNMAEKSNLEDLFYGSQIVSNENVIVTSSQDSTYIIDSNNGSIIYKLNFVSKIKPLLINNYLFLISNNDLLISFDMINGQIIYSYNINKKISEFLKIKQKEAQFKFITMANNTLFIILKNSFVLKFSIDGTLKKVYKLPSKIKTNPVFVNNVILFLNSKNKLLAVN